MSRYRLIPTPEQEHALRVHCAQAVQLTQARAEFGWLAAGSQMVQQQALRDFAQAMSNFYSGTHGKPTWRKAGQHEAFRIVRGRVEKIPPAFTSQLRSACGHVAADSRESQALFSCSVCKYTGHADANAARNIAAGHAVTARGRSPLGGRTNREPQPLLLSSA